MRYLMFAALGVAIVVALVLAIGWRLPVAHEATRTVSLAAPPETVWRAITDIPAFPRWRSDVRAVERLPDRNGLPVWVEEGGSGRVRFAVERSDPPHQLVTRIDDRDLPFGGSWTFEIVPAGSGSTLTITERGEIYNLVFRFMARFIFGYESTMHAYVTALTRALAENTAWVTTQPAR